MLLDGLLLKECADRLGITQDTVKFHSRNIYRKLNIYSRSQLYVALRKKTEAPIAGTAAQESGESGPL